MQYYLADLNLSDATELRTAFAFDTYGGGYAQTVPQIARQLDALLCVNGDYYGNSDEGVVVRNGVIYRANPTRADILCLYYDGTMAVKSYSEFDVQAEAASGIWQAWTFGPSLLDEDGQALSAFHEGRHMNGRNPGPCWATTAPTITRCWWRTAAASPQGSADRAVAALRGPGLPDRLQPGRRQILRDDLSGRGGQPAAGGGAPSAM